MGLRIVKKIFYFIFTSSWSLVRMGILAGITVAYLILNMNQFTDPDKGTMNLVITVSILVFLPTFIPLLLELFLRDLKKQAKKMPKRTTYID
ncbi:hypothetical protein IMZ31_20585 (plasmid) [Pontibacillus sp. ALD_SL1]|uniref:hypothetical protein n=1 Tax=Pontibacillus sp. ALD_SL1 TaxID=2777185 RepID=UPI001A96A3A6|nr:hypothetical protein [Pontibacillus sp. ALD_SL1]QST02947.1 hypothetical protein IMZ31_20585 [Pontibacillus sp. ALD_SL1]